MRIHQHPFQQPAAHGNRTSRKGHKLFFLPWIGGRATGGVLVGVALVRRVFQRNVQHYLDGQGSGGALLTGRPIFGQLVCDCGGMGGGGMGGGMGECE